MERDFLGLNSNSEGRLTAVKREITEQEKQWPFMKQAPSFAQFISLRAGASQDGGMNKTNALVKPNFASTSHNVTEAITRQQLQGLPLTVTSPVKPFIGCTEPWSNLKPVTAPAQMTIFYAGTVNVYDGISPEKAQAIMILAGNGVPFGSNMSLPNHNKVQSPCVNVLSTGANAVSSNQFMTSQPNLQSCKDEQIITNMNKPNLVPSALPQFRKASLARFLEKRKERVRSSGPYNSEKKQEGVFAANNNAGSAISPNAM